MLRLTATATAAALVALALPNAAGAVTTPPAPTGALSAHSAGSASGARAFARRHVARGSGGKLAHAATARSYAHSLLWCSGNQIGSDNSLTAATNGGTEFVRVSTTLLRWTGSSWVADTYAPDVASSAPSWVNVLSRWLYYPSGNAGAAPGVTFTIGNRGHYYAIYQLIRWYNAATGQLVDSHGYYLTSAIVEGYCWV